MPGTRSDFCIRSRKWSSASQWGRAYFTSITSTLSCYQGLNLTYTVTNRVQCLWWQSARHCTNNILLTTQRTQHAGLLLYYLKWIMYELKWRKVKDDAGTKEGFQTWFLLYIYSAYILYSFSNFNSCWLTSCKRFIHIPHGDMLIAN